MLLARAGYRVLLLDKATFPSDKLSTHYIQPSGMSLLEEWGLLEAVVATGAPAIETFTVYSGDEALMQPPMGEVAYCPRRYLLDEILVEAAVAAGAELRTGFKVDSIVTEGETVTGVLGHARGTGAMHEYARYVIGAEGHHSLVADAVKAPKYRQREALTGGYYSYWSGVDLPGAEVHISERGGVLAFQRTTDSRALPRGVRGISLRRIAPTSRRHSSPSLTERRCSRRRCAPGSARNAGTGRRTYRTSSVSRGVRAGRWSEMRGT